MLESGWGARIVKGIVALLVFGLLEYVLGGLGLWRFVIEVPVFGWVVEKVGLWGAE